MFDYRIDSSIETLDIKLVIHKIRQDATLSHETREKKSPPGVALLHLTGVDDIEFNEPQCRKSKQAKKCFGTKEERNPANRTWNALISKGKHEI